MQKLAFAFVAYLIASSPSSAQQPPTPQQTAQAAIQFLNRTNVSGSEVDALLLVRNFLSAIASGQLEVHNKKPAMTQGMVPPGTLEAKPEVSTKAAD